MTGDPSMPTGQQHLPQEQQLSARPEDEATSPQQERDLWRGRAAGRAFVLSWVLLGVIVVGLVLLTYGTPLRDWQWSWVTWPIILALIIIQLIRVGYKIVSRSYRLTTQRLFIRHGLVVTTTNQTDLVRVNDVQVRQNLLEKLLGVGTVIVDSPTDVSNPHAVLIGIRDPHQVAEHIHRQMRAIRDRKSLLMEAT